MRLVIVGSRTITDFDAVYDAVVFESPFWKEGVTEIVSGGARGVDASARRLSELFSGRLGVDYTEFAADWDEHGKKAGPIRNQEMVDYGDAVVAVWDGQSSGTKDTIRKAVNAGLPMYVKVVE